MSNILDDLFAWAGNLPPVKAGAERDVTVQIMIATNQIHPNNMVTYAEGLLHYRKGTQINNWLLPPYFDGNLTQYFSARRDGKCPFKCDETDEFAIEIKRSPIASGDYAARLHSKKPKFDFTVELRSDVSTQVLYSHYGATFITISLCNRKVSDTTPPK